MPLYTIDEIKEIVSPIAHNYGKIDEESLWETITEDIPLLRRYCLETIPKMDCQNEKMIADIDEPEELTFDPKL